jgi:hypothetical protein
LRLCRLAAADVEIAALAPGALSANVSSKGDHMQISIQRVIAAAALTGAFAVTGCGGNVSSSIAPSTSAQSNDAVHPRTPAQLKMLGMPFKSPAKPMADRRRSWMSPDAKKAKSLLYVADEGGNDVLVYTYPAGKLTGTLTGFQTPTGICSNKEGDVFILNGNGTTVVVYAHGGSSPIRTLNLPGYPYFNCSVDPTTGNLALGVLAGSCGNCIAVFTNATGTPTTYSPSGQNGIPGCAYDNGGNLFCDAYSGNDGFALYELPAGSSNITTVSVSGATGLGPGSIQWDGKYLAFSSNDSGTLYQIALSGSTGSIASSTTLDGTGIVWQFWLTNTSGKKAKKERVIAPTISTANVPEVGYWKYPAGGSATKTITGFSAPDGVAVSTLKK